MSSKTGTISMKGIKYKVSFGGQEIFCDGKTVWNYDKSSNEVTISNLDASSCYTLLPKNYLPIFMIMIFSI